MNFNKFPWIIFSIVVFFLTACGADPEKTPASGPAVASGEQTVQPAATGQSHPGKKVYDQNCRLCHQSEGQGVSGVFPPLTPNPFVTDKARMIDIVLNGMKGEIEVGGETYNGLMTPHSQLSNRELADVISYVRSSFGNNLEPVSIAEIEAARR